MKQNQTTMKKSGRLFAFLALCCAMFMFSNAKAQMGSNAIKDWSALGEASNHIDVAYAIIKCSLTSPAQVHLSLLNENPSNQSLNMTVTVKNNATNASFSTPITFSLNPAALVKPDCTSNTATNALKINIPAGYDPNQLTVSVTFN